MNKFKFNFIMIRKSVFYPTILVLLLFNNLITIEPQRMSLILKKITEILAENFGWVYLVISLFLVIVSFIILFSKVADVKIGGEHAKPILSTRNWLFIVICTTIAAGLIFWGVSEPIFHFANPPDFLKIEPQSREAALFSLTTMLLHWTITPYAIYTVPALMFATAIYNYEKPFSFSSSISNVIRNGNDKNISALIDSICVFSTVMGLTASLGQGILSIAGGIKESIGLNSSEGLLIIIGIFTVMVFTIAACSGITKGIKWISNINLVFLVGLMVIVFLIGPTMYTIQISLEALGIYIDNFFTRSLMLGAGSNSDWSYYWTISTFANWISWAPITGMFLGKIAYGQTVRCFICINLIATSFVAGMWVLIFGGTSIYFQINGANLFECIVKNGMESGIYELLKLLPFGKILIPILCFTVFLSFVTAADSTINALGDLCCKTKNENDRILFIVKIIWGILIGGMAILVVDGEGIAGIKLISTIGGFLATILLFISGIALLKEILKYKKGRNI